MLVRKLYGFYLDNPVKELWNLSLVIQPQLPFLANAYLKYV